MGPNHSTSEHIVCDRIWCDCRLCDSRVETKICYPTNAALIQTTIIPVPPDGLLPAVIPLIFLIYSAVKRQSDDISSQHQRPHSLISRFQPTSQTSCVKFDGWTFRLQIDLWRPWEIEPLCTSITPHCGRDPRQWHRLGSSGSVFWL